MLQAGAHWFGVEGATEAQLDELREVAPIGVPERLFALLAQSNGGEGPLPVDPMNFVLDDAHTIAEFIRAQPYGNALEGLFVIGGNGSGEFIALDLREPGANPVLTLAMVAGPASSSRVADSFDVFVSMIGFES